MKNVLGPLWQGRPWCLIPRSWGEKALQDSCSTVIQRDLFVRGHILEFHAHSPPKILQTSTSADQRGVELFLALLIESRFQAHTRHTRPFFFPFLFFFPTEAHYNRFFPTLIFLGVFTSGKYQASNPWGTSDKDPDPKHTEVCPLLPGGFPHA